MGIFIVLLIANYGSNYLIVDISGSIPESYYSEPVLDIEMMLVEWSLRYLMILERSGVEDCTSSAKPVWVNYLVV